MAVQPRFIIFHAATGESSPPDRSTITFPPVDDGNPHVFDQKPLYEGWRYKPLIQEESALTGATEEIIPYVRGVVPQPNTALARDLYRIVNQAGVPLPNVDLFGEISTQ